MANLNKEVTMTSIYSRLIVGSFMLVMLISLASSTVDQTGSNDGQLTSNGRSKRRVEDVQKLMNDDHLMALLICDLCVDSECGLDYCIYCHECQNSNPAASTEELPQYGGKNGKLTRE